jgi:hypothetical protein
MTGRRILITNDTLNTRFGGELVTRDLAPALAALGEQVMVYTPRPGSVSDEIARHEIPIVDDLAKLPFAPDLIHGNQHLEMIEALHVFPEARGLFVCHARLGWPAVPPLTDRIQHYVAVDHHCRDRLTQDYEIDPGRVSIIFNSIDTERFRQRSPLPDRPRRALVFSNYAKENNFLYAIRAACREIDLALDVIGVGVGNLVDRPEDFLPNYDVVFAKARCAIEGMAVGCAVILCDERLGPMVTAAEATELRNWNFGMRTLQLPVTPHAVLAELARYDCADARLVSDYIRANCTIATAAQQYRAVYDKVVAFPTSKIKSETTDYHRAMTIKVAAFEAELYHVRRSFRMEALTASAAAAIQISDVKISAPLHNGHLWVQSDVSNGTSERIGSYQPAPIYLSYHWFYANGQIALFEGLRTPLIPPIDPGNSATYEFKIAAPPEPGDYRLRITLVQEGIRWFEELPGFSATHDIRLTIP